MKKSSEKPITWIPRLKIMIFDFIQQTKYRYPSFPALSSFCRALITS